MSDQLTAERGGLEKKDKSELQAIVSALGGKPLARYRKSELIDQILELSGAELTDRDAAADGSTSDQESTDSPAEVDGSLSEKIVETSETDNVSEATTSDSSQGRKSKGSDRSKSSGRDSKGSGGSKDNPSSGPNGRPKSSNDDDEPNKRRRGRGRGRGRGRERDDAGNDPISSEPFEVEGFLELRDEGYGFLRVNSFLPSREDVYVSVKQVRQYGLRKGDHLSGLSRPPSRNEKNPGFHQIDLVNGRSPEDARDRNVFEEMTPVFADLELQLESDGEGSSLSTRLVDLFAPLGRGQRVLITAPPQTGTTTLVKELSQSIEKNNPDVQLFVLLVDQRPEEVTEMTSVLSDTEIVSSDYDRPPEEHCAVAEITIERAKRLVEFGQDVCLVVDSFSALARAFQATAPQNGRSNSASLEVSALYNMKRLFGTARKFEQGGSLTIIAASEAFTEGLGKEVNVELRSAANAEIRLSEELAATGIFPAIDPTTSKTTREDLLLGEEQAAELNRLRAALITQIKQDGLSSGVAKLHEHVTSTPTNDDFLAEIVKTLQ